MVFPVSSKSFFRALSDRILDFVLFVADIVVNSKPAHDF